jgi:hypothetical protein
VTGQDNRQVAYLCPGATTHNGAMPVAIFLPGAEPGAFDPTGSAAGPWSTDPGGLGLATTTLRDEQGTFGASAQTLLVASHG